MQMTLVDAPTIRPHVCVDGSQTGPLVDTQLTHPAYGRMYWPRRLVLEAARLYGMVDAETHAAVLGAVGELELKVTGLEGELAELEPVRTALVSAAERFGDRDDAPAPAPRRKVAA